MRGWAREGECLIDLIVGAVYSDEGSLDSPSDQPPMSPKVLQSPEEFPMPVTEGPLVPIETRNGEKQEKQLARLSSDPSVKIRRYLNFVLALTYLYTKPLIEIQ